MTVTALIMVSLAILLRRTRLDFYVALSAMMIAYGLFGAELWNRVGDNNFSGLPSFFLANASDDSLAKHCFLATSVALSCVSIFSLYSSGKKVEVRESRVRISSKLLNLVSASALVIWLLGNGPSILGYRTYLTSDGIAFLYQATNIAFPLLGLYCLLCSNIIPDTSKAPSGFGIAISLGMFWFVLCLASGSRTAIFFLFGIAFVLFRRITRDLGRIWKSTLVISVLTASVAYLSNVVFTITYAARSRPFGLSAILSGEFIKLVKFNLSVDELVYGLQGMASSFLSSFPITELTTQIDTKVEDALAALNPLPAALAGYAPSSNDLIFPWLPVSSLGQIYSTFQTPGVILSYLIIFTVIEFCRQELRSRGLLIEAVALQLYGAIVLMVSIQYPLRITSRLFFFVLILATVLLIQKYKPTQSTVSNNSIFKIPFRRFPH